MGLLAASRAALTSSLPGLDWSEDSGEDDVEQEDADLERDRPFHSSWRPQDGSVQQPPVMHDDGIILEPYDWCALMMVDRWLLVS